MKIEDWNTSKVTDMEDLFVQSYDNIDISRWNTSNVTSMKSMFYSFKWIYPNIK